MELMISMVHTWLDILHTEVQVMWLDTTVNFGTNVGTPWAKSTDQLPHPLLLFILLLHEKLRGMSLLAGGSNNCAVSQSEPRVLTYHNMLLPVKHVLSSQIETCLFISWSVWAGFSYVIVDINSWPIFMIFLLFLYREQHENFNYETNYL